MNALFLGSIEDKEYVPHLKGFFGGTTTFVLLGQVTLLTQLEMYCTKNKITKVVSTNTLILSKLLELQGNFKGSPSLSDYAGSLFSYKNLEIVFIDPLKQLFTVSYGKFLAERFISKVVNPQKWQEPTKFEWKLCSGDLEPVLAHLEEAYAIAIDIETFKNPLSIRCISYTGIYLDSVTGALSTFSYVLPLDSEYNYVYMKKFNATRPPKIFQNGKYDNSYFLRYGAPCTNWLWDTAHLFHCFYSELPKDLGFLNAFFLRKVVYWKDLAETNDLFEYYKYNALDGWATSNVWIQQLIQLPEWAKRNYALEFPLVFPCLLAEMTGIERDVERMKAARAEIDIEEASMLATLRKMLRAPNFNPGSPVQVKTLLKMLGCGDITSSGVKELFKARIRHPLNELILGMISRKKEEDGTSIRGLRKLRSTYLRLDSDKEGNKNNGAKEFRGRVLYALNPHATDTSRLASREHHFWCGLQIQNIPAGKSIKQTLRASDGFYLAEGDLKTAETFDTAYIAGDLKLIEAVSGSRDFHSLNASAFFGIPYVDIFDDSIRKTLNKKLRDLSKRVNHGANYNMGIFVLIDTMGPPAIWEASRILKLPGTWGLEEIAEYLLTIFHITYSVIRGPIHIRNDSVRNYLKLPKSENKLYAAESYYGRISYEIEVTRRITSRAYHHTKYNLATYTPEEYIERGDWTRYCFGQPSKNKQDLNSYVAHPPQSLNARTLNEGFMRVFYEVALPNAKHFRLHAQIHDSILFSYKEGRHDLANEVKRCMEIPVTVRDVFGTYRTFTVPVDLKLGKVDKVTGELKRAVYWSETE